MATNKSWAELKSEEHSADPIEQALAEKKSWAEERAEECVASYPAEMLEAPLCVENTYLWNRETYTDGFLAGVRAVVDWADGEAHIGLPLAAVRCTPEHVVRLSDLKKLLERKEAEDE